MEKIIFNVGIIDDDETKCTQIMSRLDDFVDEASAEIFERYEGYQLNPKELEIRSDIDELLAQIIEENIDVLIVDYKLSSYSVNVDYSGVSFAKRTNEKFLDFPIFILTSFEAELYKHEVFNAYQVYDFERYLNDKEERIEINTKIVEQCIKYQKQIEEWKEELNQLLKREGESPEIDAKIMQLDSKLERTFGGESSIPESMKRKLDSDNFDKILSLLDEVLKGE